MWSAVYKLNAGLHVFSLPAFVAVPGEYQSTLVVLLLPVGAQLHEGPYERLQGNAAIENGCSEAVGVRWFGPSICLKGSFN